MNDRSDRQPERASRAPGRPGERRPPWVGVLSFCMLAFGGHLLMGGLSVWQGLNAAGSATGPSAFEAPVGSEQAIVQEMRAVSRSLAQSYPLAVRLNAASKVGMALLLLYAVAAVLSGDRRGRGATLVAAWAGMAYHLADAAFLLIVVREGMAAAAPAMLAAAAAHKGGGPTLSAEELIAFARTAMVLVSVASAVLGIGFSVLLVVFFGGRRGRRFFGLEQRPHGA